MTTGTTTRTVRINTRMLRIILRTTVLVPGTSSVSYVHVHLFYVLPIHVVAYHSARDSLLFCIVSMYEYEVRTRYKVQGTRYKDDLRNERSRIDGECYAYLYSYYRWYLSRERGGKMTSLASVLESVDPSRDSSS
jgi:hypothetical protein